MAVEANLISFQLNGTELRDLDEALNKIQNILSGYTRNLTPEERQQFGRIAKQNKLFVDRAKAYMEEYPQFVPAFIDKAEFDRDYVARELIEGRLRKLISITEQLSDTKILSDNDNYSNALTFYRNIRFLSGEKAPGTTSIWQYLAQFFRLPSSGATKQTAKPDKTSES